MAQTTAIPHAMLCDTSEKRIVKCLAIMTANSILTTAVKLMCNTVLSAEIPLRNENSTDN